MVTQAANPAGKSPAQIFVRWLVLQQRPVAGTESAPRKITGAALVGELERELGFPLVHVLAGFVVINLQAAPPPLAVGRGRDVPGQALLRGPVKQCPGCAGQPVRVTGMPQGRVPAGRHAANENGAWIVSTHPARLFTRDQMMTALTWAASMVVLDASRRGQRVPLLAAWSLAAGIATTVGANLAHGLGHGAVGVLVSG